MHFIYATGWAGLGKYGKPSTGLGKLREHHPNPGGALLQSSNSVSLWLYCVCILKELKLEVESREVQMLRPNVICEGRKAAGRGGGEFPESI